MAEGLTIRQQRFIAEYLRDGNATQSYIRAGYAARGNVAEVNSYQLLRNPKIMAALRESRMTLTKKTDLNTEWVESRLMLIAERCMQHEPVLDRTGTPTGEYQFDSSGANRALELLGKRLKMFEEKSLDLPPINQFFLNAPSPLLIELAAKIREKMAGEGSSIEVESRQVETEQPVSEMVPSVAITNGKNGHGG